MHRNRRAPTAAIVRRGSLNRCSVAAPTSPCSRTSRAPHRSRARASESCATVWYPSTLPEVRSVSLVQAAAAAAAARLQRHARRYPLRRAPRAHPFRTQATGRQAASVRGGRLLRSARCEHSEHSESASLRRSGRNSVRVAARHPGACPNCPNHALLGTVSARARPGRDPGALGQPHGDTTRPPAASFFTVRSGRSVMLLGRNL
jgi:hypothetical protein